MDQETSNLLASATAQLRAGQLQQACATLSDILARSPGCADALNMLAGIARQQGHTDDAVNHLRAAIAAEPRRAELHLNLGEAFYHLGQLTAAEAAYRLGLSIAPDMAELHCNLGNVLLRLDSDEEALTHLRRAVTIAPQFAEAHYNLGRCYQKMHRHSDAMAAYLRAAELRPDLAQAYYNVGVLLQTLEQPSRAAEMYENALAIRPNYLHALNNLGGVLSTQGRNDRAVQVLTLALKLKPDYGAGASNLAAHFGRVGEAQKAIELARRAVTFDPSNPAIRSALIFRMLHDPDTSQQQIGEELSRWNDLYASKLAAELPPPAPRDARGRRLRLGFVSADFCDHVIVWNTLPLFRELDRERFEIHCYSNSHRHDRGTQRMIDLSQSFTPVAAMSDRALAQRIRDDGIDVMFDMNLHTASHRLLALARRPAPVQFTFAGYPGSTGLKAIDYRISDPYLDPPGMFEATCSEQIARLPHSFWCFEPQSEDPDVNELPAARSGQVTFACLNQLKKVNHRILALYARVLLDTPGSRLVMLATKGNHREQIVDQFSRHGVAPGRVFFVEPSRRPLYMRHYHLADISLDPMPYGGHTTALDSLWMGVPIVTLPGDTIASRAGLGMLTELKMPELIASSEDDYVTIAQGLAADIPRLSQIRRELRDRMRASSLMDAKTYTRAFELAILNAWQRPL